MKPLLWAWASPWYHRHSTLMSWQAWRTALVVQGIYIHISFRVLYADHKRRSMWLDQWLVLDLKGNGKDAPQRLRMDPKNRFRLLDLDFQDFLNRLLRIRLPLDLLVLLIQLLLQPELQRIQAEPWHIEKTRGLAVKPLTSASAFNPVSSSYNVSRLWVAAVAFVSSLRSRS